MHDDDDFPGYQNTVSSLQFLRALGLRASHLSASCDHLRAFASAGEQLLEADAASACPSLSPYTVRAAIVVMACATIEGALMDLGTATKQTERLHLAPKDLRGSSLDQCRLFFKKVAHLRFPDDTETWRKLGALFQLRHAIVHSWGRIRDDCRDLVASLQGVVISQTGEAWLETSAVGEALDIMQAFADELEAYLGGDQGNTGDT